MISSFCRGYSSLFRSRIRLRSEDGEEAFILDTTGLEDGERGGGRCLGRI